MPIGYLEVPTGLDRAGKARLVKAMYDAMHEVYPFPDDTRIFLREWPLDSVSQNGQLGSEPARPVCVMHVPQGGDLDARRTMLKKIDAAVTAAYPPTETIDQAASTSPAGHGYFATFLHEHTLDTVVIDGGILADDLQRVEDQTRVYG